MRLCALVGIGFLHLFCVLWDGLGDDGSSAVGMGDVRR